MALLADRSDVVQDRSARSLSFFCTEDVLLIDREWIDSLVEESVENGDCNARICMHSSPDANFHEMLILEREGFYFRPHKHFEKGESWHIIEGKLVVLIFNDEGKVIRRGTMGQDGLFLGRVGINQWHTLIPLTEYAIYHEAKPGPFLGTSDSIYPDWAPDNSDELEAQKYLTNLLSTL